MKNKLNIKKLITYLVETFGIAGTAIILYSSGLVGLRLSDPNIFRAGMSIISGVLLAGGFGVATHHYLLPEKQHIKTLTAKIDITELTEKIKGHSEDAYMGKLASQAIAQIDRLNNSINRAEYEVTKKFEPGSLTYQEFYGAITNASNCAFENLNRFANRLGLYDDSEFIALRGEDYKYDDIPNEIQEKQKDLMKKNFNLCKDSLAANENLILGLDSLAMELASANVKTDSEGTSELLKNITELTETIKYYI